MAPRYLNISLNHRFSNAKSLNTNSLQTMDNTAITSERLESYYSILSGYGNIVVQLLDPDTLVVTNVRCINSI